jgi:hypothetical protein
VSAQSTPCAYAARKRSCRPVIADINAFPAEPCTLRSHSALVPIAAFDRRALSAQSQVRRTNDIPHEVHSSSPGHANGRAATASADYAVPHPASGLQRRGARTAAKGALGTREGALSTREYALCVRRVCLPTALYACGRARSVLSRLRVLTAHTARVPAVPRECRVSTVGGAAVKNHESSNSYSHVALQRLQSFTAAAAFIALIRLSSNSYRLCGFKSKYSRPLYLQRLWLYNDSNL